MGRAARTRTIRWYQVAAAARFQIDDAPEPDPAHVSNDPRDREMKPQVLSDWQELSALYEQADALDDDALDAWLAALRAQPHPLLGQLEQMLKARSDVRHNGFLDAPPALRIEAEPVVHEWREGSRIGPYRLVRRLGSGGMAEVWLADRDDGAFQRQVAIKLLFRHAGAPAQRDSFAQRFARERDILASLHHPHIAGLHDAGVTSTGQPWLALEYVEGEPLTWYCDRRGLDIVGRVRLFRQVLLAVQHAHANLVIHRDLKPANILVTEQGEVRLLDFGIAKLMEPEGGALIETELTRLSGRPLTVAYASPEQLLGQPLGTACDVYSLGVVFYELLCGERPYELKMESAAQLEQAILDVEPRPPSRRALAAVVANARASTPAALRKQLENDLDAIALRALGKRPALRYGSVDALRADIDRWLDGEPVQARTPSAWYHLRKFVGRHPVGVSLGAASILSLVGVAAVALWLGVQAREESARAVAARDFMLNIFQRADQEKSRGATVTARDLLATGRRDVATTLADQPALQAELLRGIAKIQHDMGEYEDADSTFAELARIYTSLGRPLAAAAADADQADNAIFMGDPKRAATLLATGRTNAGSSGGAELRARFAEVEGWIELSQGNAPRARELFTASRDAYLAALGPEHARTFGASRALARAERSMMHFDAAIDLFAQLERTAAARPAVLDPKERAAFDWEQVDLFYSAGLYERALQASDGAIARCLEREGAGDQNCLALLLKRGQTYLRLGMWNAAKEQIPRVAPIVDDKSSAPSRVEALVFRYRAEMYAGIAHDEATRQSLDAFASPDQAVRIGPTFRAAAALTLAEEALHRADPTLALKWIAAADQHLAGGRRSAGSDIGQAVGTGLRGMAQVLLGDQAAAATLLRQGRERLGKVLGDEHPQTLLMALNEALALERQDRRSDAAALVAHASSGLRRSLGASSPAYIRVRALEQRLSLEPAGSSRGAAAANDFFF